MLTVKEKELVLALLEKKFIAAGNIIAYVQATLGPAGAHITGELSANGGPGPLAKIVLDRCITNGWRPDPPLLSRLLQELAVYEGIPEILERLVPPPAAASPYEARILVDRRVFLGRDTGRQMMKRLRDGPGYYAAVVNGERSSGKSYTAFFAMHLARSFADFGVATVDVPRGTGAGFKAEDLALGLVRSMGRMTALPENLNPSAEKRAQDLAMFVLAEAAESRQSWWLVLDGLDDPDIDPTAFYLVEQLISRISKNIVANKVRVLLLSYAQPLAQSLKPAIIFEQPPLSRATVGEIALRECFTQLFSAKGTTAANLAPTVEAAVAEVLRRAIALHPTTAQEWLIDVSAAAQEVVDAVS